MALSKLAVPGRPTIWMIVGQGPTALAVGAGGDCLDILLSSTLSLLCLSLSLGFKPKPTNHPTLVEIQLKRHKIRDHSYVPCNAFCYLAIP